MASSGAGTWPCVSPVPPCRRGAWQLEIRAVPVAPIVPVHGDPPPPHAIAAAWLELAAGRIVGLPTDTVYGLAADRRRPDAIGRIYRAKGRPDDLALPVLVSGVDQARSVAEIGERGLLLMQRFWPGGLTIVLPGRPGPGGDPRADRGVPTVGVRCPLHPAALALCAAVGPLATTSANLHGEPTPATASGVAAIFGTSLAMVLDGGRCEGKASTVVDATGATLRLLREGAIAWETVLGALG